MSSLTALYDYNQDGAQHLEISFKAGEIIQVLEPRTYIFCFAIQRCRVLDSVLYPIVL